MIRKTTLVFCLVFVSTITLANNIQLSNVQLVNQNTTTHTVNIQFNISWQNSWRTASVPNNHDAAWIFAKFKNSSGEWQHVSLANQSADHSPASGVTIDAVSDGKGVFLYRSSDGSGLFSSSGNKIRWEYGSDGLADSDQLTLKLFAIEMVYIPEGSFYAGSDTTNSGDINALMVVGTGSAQPFLVSTTLVGSVKSEGTGISDSQDDDVLKAINGYTGIGIDGDGGLDTDNDGSIDNASFPTGYGAFYLMKYEVSQIQYVEFLNTLTRTQQNSRTSTQTANYYAMTGGESISYRNSIRVPSSVGAGTITFGCDLNANGTFNETDDGMAEGANFINWLDITAYLDWAGLRPYTELEFVKAVRGPSSPVAGEYVWGDFNITAASSLTHDGQDDEIAGNSSSNVNALGGVGGPMRVGNFAQTTTRSQAGAGYYGNMDMGGNLWEVVIPLGTTGGRAFTGGNGNGELTAGGGCDVANWQPASGQRVGQRGGPFAGSANECRIANRNYSARQSYSRREFDGCRGARTAPVN